MAIDVRAEYDEGYFDKDEQGWCARCVEVSTEGDRVTIRRHGDDNGIRAYDETKVGKIGKTWPELGLVQIVDERGPLAYFDAGTGRLRTPGEQMPHWFTPPLHAHGPGDFAAGLAIVVPVAVALGMQPGPPPTRIEMPAPVPKPHSGNALQSEVSLPGENGYTWVFTRRVYPDGSMGPEFDVRVEGHCCWVSLWAEGTNRRAMLLFMGPLERYHLAIAARDPAIAKWCGEDRPPGD